MSIIRILPQETANRIAAGEVVERPASVVKELVENAIDAGAGRIVVAAQQGGRRLIQVTDDGCGMDRDDALLCLEAHATSKIHDAFDIDHISTLGFRGEALPSIAAVSQFQLQTRRPEDVSGSEIIVEGGEIRDVRDCGCAAGTNVRVRNLFYNLPARRKFLRTPQTEDSHIQETVLMQALAHPEMAFELHLNGVRVLQVGGGGDPGARIAMLLGREVYEAMLPVDYSEEEVRVRGFVARPGFTRTRRREQRAFVNGRPAESNSIYAGLRDAYNTLVMAGRYPPAVLSLELPPDRVDVNVHPTKREVRFRDGGMVSAVVAAAVRRALRPLAGAAAAPLPANLPVPGTGFPCAVRRPSQEAIHELIGRQRSLAGLAPDPPPGPGCGGAFTGDSGSPPPPAAAAGGGAGCGQREKPPDNASPAPLECNPEIGALNILGLFNDRYLVAQGSAGLVLVDYRAAAERILFEKMLRNARDREGMRQPLLLPVTIDLSPSDAKLLRDTREKFCQLGFEIEPFGGQTFLVTALPAHFPQENIGGMVRDMLDDLREGAGAAGMPRPDDVRIAQVASRRASRSVAVPAADECRRMLDELSRTQMPYAGPTGKPVMINFPFSEIERRFGKNSAAMNADF